ncbi:glycoside hydrolase family 5 protein [Mycena sanguinolenta]|nr:glycoside hydrolase family 5 protein [Mycena sanguinolenta]
MMQERPRAGGDPFVSHSSLDNTYADNDDRTGGYSDYVQPHDFAAPRAAPPSPNTAANSPYGGYQASQSQFLNAEPYHDDPTYPPASPNNSGMHLPLAPSSAHRHVDRSVTGGGRSRGRRWVLVGVLAVVVVAAAVVIPLYFLVIKKHHDDDASGSKNGSGTTASGKTVLGAISGGDGSTVTTTTGESFVYNNSFGGYWLSDPSNPFLDGARANSWTPPLNESWTWGVDRVYGVNLGGWFVLEPFITPALFQAYPSAPDEWTLASLMRADGTLQSTMEKHYDTFITEQDIAAIAGAGLNWVRVPIGFWAISTWTDVGVDETGATVAEPFLEGVAWPYIVRLLGWARKYGLRVNLDLHTAPGSQNGYNHSGKLGQINFLNGPMGFANAQRMLDYIRVIVEFITQPEYANLIPMFGIVNEAFLPDIGMDVITSFYLQAHNMIRGITGVGEGHGPFISIHDGFQGVSGWAGFLTGSDRIILDTHPYFAFDGAPNDSPIATGLGTGAGGDGVAPGGIWPKQACDSWAGSLNTSRIQFGVTVAGEFSNGYNDCGLYLVGVNSTTHFGGDCTLFMDASTWNDTLKAGVKEFAMASMDATQDWFFWTWKIGPALNGVVQSPLWSYSLGLQNGFMPTDPRDSVGICASLDTKTVPFNGTFQSWQTGGAGAGTIAASDTASFGAWPPKTLSSVNVAPTLLPTYTPTASIPSLTWTTPTPTSAGSGSASAPTITASVGSGWFDAADTALVMTAVAGCTYPDAWSALSSAVPAVCTGTPAA